MDDLHTFIQRIPKAELHVHIEGTLEPELLFQLASRNNITLPYTLEECIDKRKHFTNLQDFLNMYYDACQVLQTEADFYELAMAYFARAAQEGIKHCEVFFDPQTHLARGVSFDAIINGLHRAKTSIQDVSVQWIMCFLRDKPVESAMQTVDLAITHADKIAGVGLDSAEDGYPGSLFKEVYARCRASGLCGADGMRVCAHAGEEGDPSYVIDALHALGVARVDHGIRALEDPYLLAYLRQAQVPLTICPNSNRCLQVKARYFPNRLPLRELYEANILITVNSDDPAFFGGYLVKNYEEILQDFSELNTEQLKALVKTLASNSFKASFISEEDRGKWLEAIEQAT